MTTFVRPRGTVLVVACVAAAHGAALWALQRGLAMPASVTPPSLEVVAELLAPAPVAIAPTPAPAPRPRPAPAPAPAPVPSDTQPAPAEPPSAPVAAAAAAPAPAPAPAAAPAPAVAAAPAVELPSSNAAYLQNPPPPYPPASRRLHEQGKVIVHVLIGADGHAQDAQLKQSSGYDRLDAAAIQTVRTWRYVPGKRAGVPTAMWFDVPLNFILD